MALATKARRVWNAAFRPVNVSIDGLLAQRTEEGRLHDLERGLNFDLQRTCSHPEWRRLEERHLKRRVRYVTQPLQGSRITLKTIPAICLTSIILEARTRAF